MGIWIERTAWNFVGASFLLQPGIWAESAGWLGWVWFAAGCFAALTLLLKFILFIAGSRP